MQKFISWLERVLSPIADKLANNRFLKSIADGMVATMPLTMVAALFSIVSSLPAILPFLPAWSPEIQAAITAPYSFLYAMLALVISFTVARCHAKRYDLKEMNCGIVSMLCFIMIAGLQADGSIDTAYFGYNGIFTAVLTALLTVEIYRLMVQRRLWIRMPDSIPPMVSSSFETIIPMFVLIVTFHALSLLCQAATGLMVPALIQSAVTPAIEGSDSVWYQVVYHFFMQLFFWFGMHGWAVLAGVAMPITTALLAGNAEAAAAGQALPFFTAGSVNPMGTFHWFLPLMLIFLCKAKRNRAIGKAGLIPGIFGIGEPLQFGIPIVLNPILGIPYILYQPICVGIIMLVTKFDLMSRSAVNLASIPQPFAMWLGCNGDLRCFFWFAVLALASVLIWYPFLKVWDNRCLKEEAETAAEVESA